MRNDDDQVDGQRAGDEELLKRIRDRYKYASDQWRDIREEGAIDMRYLTGDPWEPEDRQERKDNGRPCINHDELTQYVNQCVNNLRQNPRGIKIEPAGNGATDQTAEFRQALIRGIEYRSNAQRLAYIPAFESMVQRSYGFLRVTRDYVNDRSFNQEHKIKGIPNPDSVLYDPDYKAPDGSDARYCFVLDPLPKEEFKRKYPKARKVDFSAEDFRIAGDWLSGDRILIAEYWEADIEAATLYELADGSTVEELPEGVKATRERPLERRVVTQYITNGVEILERTPSPGPYLGIIAFFGKEMYLKEGGESKRVLFSLPRLARDPQMSYAYLCSQEMEEAGMTPKTPFIGYKGQFDSDQEAWDNLNRQPRPYVQVDPVVDAADGRVLPHPQRQPFQPNFAAYELAKDSCKRAIQAAMGISPLPTAAQRRNEKSGVALQQIAAQENLGTFHFMDNFDRGLELVGRVIESQAAKVYDTEREVPLHMPDGSRQVARINTAEPYADPQTGEPRHYQIDQGDHDPTISTGPSYQSQREEAGAFADTLAGTVMGPKVMDLIIKMKNLGPLGDEMAQRLTPPEFAKPGSAEQAAGQVQQMTQQLQQLHAYSQQLEGEMQKLQQEKQAKVLDNEYRMALEKLRIDADIAKAEIATKAQHLEERLKFVEDVWQQLHGQGHEAGMQADAQQHQASMAQQQQEAAAAQAQQQQAAEAAQAAAAPAPGDANGA